MNFVAISNWIAFVTFLSILVQNEYALRTGKKVADTREKKWFRYSMWIATVGFLILALIGS